MTGNLLIALSIILPMVSTVFVEDYRALRSEEDFLYNIQYSYVEIDTSPKHNLKCQMLRKGGKVPIECRPFRVEYKWIVAASALMIVGGLFVRRRSRF